VAGGVGITPIRALAEAMASEERDVCLLYRARREKDVIFRAELDELARGAGVRVQYLLTEVGAGSRGRIQWFQPDSLQRIVPDLLEREVYICGPPQMTRDLTKTLHGIGVDPAHVHSEAFRY
jgi:ferredoxin-NADP reductase